MDLFVEKMNVRLTETDIINIKMNVIPIDIPTKNKAEESTSPRWCSIFAYEDPQGPLGVKYATLQAKVGEYLSYGSIDGKAERQTLRKELAELIK